MDNYEIAKENRKRILEAFKKAVEKECDQLAKYHDGEVPSDFNEVNNLFPDALCGNDLISESLLESLVESLLHVSSKTLALPDISVHAVFHEKTSKERLEDNGYDSGNIVVLENESYDSALIGVSDDNRAVYSYDRMVEWYMDKNNCSATDAMEWIDCNTIRALPYVGAQAPIIVYEFLND